MFSHPPGFRRIILSLSISHGYIPVVIFMQLWVQILCGDKLALLSATLRTYQKVSCDSNQVVIACPRGTSISIEFAQYNKFIAKDGISLDELCPVESDDSSEARAKAKQLLRGSTFGFPTQKLPENRYLIGTYLTEVVSSSGSTAPVDTVGEAAMTTSTSNNDEIEPENCMWPNALQFYGLEASGVGESSSSSNTYKDNNKSTKTTVTMNVGSIDPCPKRRKLIEVAYKCRPYEFRSKVACHNDVAQLECNPYSRIAVYSASFGRTEYESIQCPQPQGVREETCLASYATETVMQICHGRRRCNLAADANTFGSPCQPNSRMYLKVVYTCVPKQVLMDRYETEVEADEPEDFEGDINDLYDDELFYKESEAIPKLYSNTTAPAARNNVSIVVNGTFNAVTNVNRVNNASLDIFEGDLGGVNPVMTHSSDINLEDDQERLFVYLLTAGSVGVILCIFAVAIRLVVLKQHDSAIDTYSNSSGKAGVADILGTNAGTVVGSGEVAETTIPNSFCDTISDIDGDIDLQTQIPLPSVSKNENYVSYAPATNICGTLGRGSSLVPQIGTSAAPSLVTNTKFVYGPRQSPDIIGISSQSYSSTNTSTILTPAIVIGSGGGSVVSSGNAVMGTMVPITSLAQYTTAPTFRSGYLLNSNSVQSQSKVGITSLVLADAESCLQQQYQQHQTQPSIQGQPNNNLSSGTSTLRRANETATSSPPNILQQPLTSCSISTYDGLAPRTHSTGVSNNSNLYYE